MALIRGATGLIYFVHQFKPEFREAALLDDPEMVAAVTAINREIQEWAPVLNQPTVREGLQVTSSQSDVPIAVMEKRTTRESHVFAVNLSNRPSQVVFTRTNAPDGTGSKLAVAIQVVGEGRRLESSGTGFADEFSAYAVHHYRWSR